LFLLFIYIYSEELEASTISYLSHTSLHRSIKYLQAGR
jgi:hypothetical protein